MKFKMNLAAALACATLMSPSAWAQTVPAATATGFIGSWNNCNATLSGAGSGTGGSSSTTGGCTNDVSVSAYYVSGKGSVSTVQNTYATGFNEIEQTNASVTSYFEVIGPSNPSVPLIFSATGSTSVSAVVGSYGYATASVETGSLGATIYSVGACSMIFYDCGGTSSTVGLPSSFNVNQSLSLAAGTLYAVVIGAQGYSNAGGFSASVDPSVTFAPGFNATGYSIVYSSDLSPAPVPLPASAWLFLTGLAGAGVMVRKRATA